MARPFTDAPDWSGETVVVVAGGPSLSFSQVRAIAKARLEGRCRVIAVNDAIFWCWWADWLHACDFKWWSWHIQTVQHFAGIKTTLSETTPDAWVDGWLEETGVQGYDPEPGKIRHGSNGGYQAMHLAIDAGASRIVIAGIDCTKGPEGQTHCHGGHENHRGHVDHEGTMAPNFETLVPALKQKRISAANVSDRSVLRCFAKMSIEEALRC